MTALLAPVVTSVAIELGRSSNVFKKQVLKVGTINYGGRRLDFTPDYLDGLVSAYRDGAYDAIPLVFADAQNRHTQDPSRIRGEIVDLTRSGDALVATIRVANEQAAQLLREHPKLGVSVRIEQPLERADGKSWPAAVQHVLATQNPRITGMTPWQSVDLSVDGETAIDLSVYDLAPTAPPQAPSPEQTQQQQVNNPTAAELAALATLLLAGATAAAIAAWLGRLGYPAKIAEKVADMPGITTEPGAPVASKVAARRTDMQNAVLRARFITNAARRVTREFVDGTPLDEAIAAEKPNWDAHRAAGRSRMDAAAKLDDEATKTGAAAFTWTAVHDSRTDSECKRLDGTQFTLADPPGGKYPGQVHPNCRCTATPVATDTNLSRETSMNEHEQLRNVYAKVRSGEIDLTAAPAPAVELAAPTTYADETTIGDVTYVRLPDVDAATRKSMEDSGMLTRQNEYGADIQAEQEQRAARGHWIRKPDHGAVGSDAYMPAVGMPYGAAAEPTQAELEDTLVWARKYTSRNIA